MCYSRLRKAVSVNVLFITCSYDFGGIIMDHFKLVSEYAPTGDQPQAIAELVEGFREGNQFETLLELPVPVRPLPWPMSFRH